MLLQFLSRLADFVTNNRAMIPWPKSEDPSAGKLAAEMANYVCESAADLSGSWYAK